MQELPCQVEMLASNIQGGFIKFATAVKGENSTYQAQPAPPAVLLCVCWARKCSSVSSAFEGYCEAAKCQEC